MAIAKRDLDQAFAEYRSRYGGRKEDYFALLYLTRQFEKQPDQVAHHVAFGEEGAEGINAFHMDLDRRNLYLFQFQWSVQHQAFREPLKRLAREGMERIFGPTPEQPGRLLAELRESLHEDQAVIERVMVHFVYNGDPIEADRSATLEALREELDSKKHLIDRCLDGRNVSLTFQFISNETRTRVGGRTSTTHAYDLAMSSVITSVTETGEHLHVGFVRLLDLYRMYREMNQRLFARNIRAGLDPDGPVNRKIRAALADISEGKAPASAFVFNHNGITVFAEELDIDGDRARIVEPRVLNGAQTITSVAKFIETSDDDSIPAKHSHPLANVQVLAKIVSHAQEPFITAVTINTNRQNPVEPANLRASDWMQCRLQDKFRDELAGVFYERQEKSFRNLSEEDLEGEGFDADQTRAIEMKRLARTFLAAQGEVDRMSRLNEMFETESQYRACFAERYLKSDAHRILLTYKVQFRLGRIAQEIQEEGGKGYWYVTRVKNLLWALIVQGVFNHAKLGDWCEAYGAALTVEADFSEELKTLGVSKVRHVIREAVADPRYKEQLDDQRVSFLRTKAFYARCMEVAEKRYGWTKESL